jgi:SAM-dependent methyltransferase
MDGLWLGSWLRFIAGTRLGPYVPTPHHVVTRMLHLANVRAADCVHDVGCGDGRLLLAAATQHGARGVGYELDARLAAAARDAVAAAGLSARLEVRQADARHACFDGADVVIMYLSEGGNLTMLPLLRAAAAKRVARGAAPARIVTFTFPIAGVTPTGSTRVDGIDLFLYTITDA